MKADFSLLNLPLPDSRIVAIDNAHALTGYDLHKATMGRRQAAAQRRRILLNEQEPFAFLATLLAILIDGHVAVIPPNFQPQTLAAFADLAPPVGVPPQTIEMYTSGSSGEPKCVRKALHQLEAECRALESLWGERATGTTVLATTPHHHIYGLLFRLLWPLLAGRPFDNVTISEPTAFVDRLRAMPDALLISSPAQLSRMHQLVDLGCLAPPRLSFSSGGPLSADTASCYASIWGMAPIEVFGSTESGGIAWRQQDRNTHWTALPEVEVAAEMDGALQVRSPFLPDASPLRMEDTVEFDEAGRFRLLGRLDRIVKIEEKRLSLPEMEGALLEHSAVKAAAIAPVTLAGRTLVGAIVVPKIQSHDRKSLIKALREHLRLRFDNVLLPRRWRFVDVLPYNERGKLVASELTRLLEAMP